MAKPKIDFKKMADQEKEKLDQVTQVLKKEYVEDKTEKNKIITSGVRRGRPKKYTAENPRVTTSIVITKEHLNKLKMIAMENNMTASDMVMKWINDYKE